MLATNDVTRRTTVKINVVYSPGVLDADADESLAAAATRMRDNDVSSLAIMQGSQLIGILSERDIVQAVVDGVSPTRTRIGRYMTESPATVHLEDDSADVARRMIELGVRHLPVVEGGRVVGVVSARDLLTLEARISS
jgi:CBS domain-containing protein